MELLRRQLRTHLSGSVAPRGEDGLAGVVVLVGFLVATIFLTLVMIIGFIIFAQQPASAASAEAGTTGSITINKDDVKAMINQKGSDGLFHAPEIMVESYIKTSLILPARVKDIPSIANCRMRWQMLAGIGRWESGHGTSNGPDPNAVDEDHKFFNTQDNTWSVIRTGTAQGPMQIEDGTWNEGQGSVSNKFNVDANGDAVENRDNAWDSTLAAAMLICDRTGGEDFSAPGNASQITLAIQKYCYPSNPSACPFDVSNRGTSAVALDGFSLCPVGKVDDTSGCPSSPCAMTEGLTTRCSIRYVIATGETVAAGVSGKIDTVVKAAMDQLGKPYCNCGDRRFGPDVFDCSGLVVFAYRAIGIELAKVTYTQYPQGQHINTVPELQKGDLVFFTWHAKDPLGHVGIFIGNNSYVHAPHPGDHVKVSTFDSATMNAFRGGSRILDGNGNRLPDWGGK